MGTARRRQLCSLTHTPLFVLVRYNGSGGGWYVYRAYNGSLYADGRGLGTNAKYHPGSIITMELDMDEGGAYRGTVPCF